jgi:heme/copper-type cytochrome/quinol oxidase subunit 4
MKIAFVFSIICLIIAFAYVNEGDAAHTAFWIGLAILNYITSLYLLSQRVK